MMSSVSSIKDKKIKSKQIKSLYFLSIQTSYNVLELELYKDNSLLEKIKQDHIKASSNLIPLINEIFKKHNLSLTDLSFIAIDKGPGAFTSLRVGIATVNGISFATKIPLIGIDGLDGLSSEVFDILLDKKEDLPDLIIPVLNAYNNDVYYSINQINKKDKQLGLFNQIEQNKGYKKIDSLLEDLKDITTNKTIVFTGNGVKLHKDLIQEKLANNILIFNNLDFCSAKQIAKISLQDFNNQKNLSYKIYPLYLKEQTFAIRPIGKKTVQK